MSKGLLGGIDRGDALVLVVRLLYASLLAGIETSRTSW